MAAKTGNVISVELSASKFLHKSGFNDNSELDESVPRRLRQPPTTGSGIISYFDANLVISASPSLFQSFTNTFAFTEYVMVLQNPGFPS